jgi:hypothetical protein
MVGGGHERGCTCVSCEDCREEGRVAGRAEATREIAQFLRRRAFKGPVDDYYADLIEQEFSHELVR